MKYDIIIIFSFLFFFLLRSVVTGAVVSWDPSPQLVSPSWRRQRPRNWLPNLVKLFEIKNVCPIGV